MELALREIEKVRNGTRDSVDLDAFNREVDSYYSGWRRDYVHNVLGPKGLRVIAETSGLGVEDCLTLARAHRVINDEKKFGVREKYREIMPKPEHKEDYDLSNALWVAEETWLCGTHFDKDHTPEQVNMEVVKDFSKSNNSFRHKYWAAKERPDWMILPERFAA